MKQDSFEQEFFVQADYDTVFKLLSDMNNHVVFQPLAESVKEVKDIEVGKDDIFPTHLRVVKNVAVLGISFPVKLLVSVRVESSGEIISEVFRFPRIRITSVIECKPENQGVRINEMITLSAPNILFGFVFWQAQQAHVEMKRKLIDYFGG